MSESLAVKKKTNRMAKPVEAFLRIAADMQLDPDDPNSFTYAERLALHAWKKALSNDRDSFKWAELVLDRTEGKVANELKIEDAGRLVEQIISKLSNSGMNLPQILTFLQAMGVEQQYIPDNDFIDAEVINGQ